MNRFHLPVISKREVAENTLEVSFDISSVEFNFLPGQYVRVVLPKLSKNAEPRGNGREFSICSSPNDKKRLTVAFRRSGSKFKQLLAAIPLGEVVVVEGPYGNMTFPKNDSPLIFIAGGTGIAPFMSMVRWATERKLPNKISLIYANRNEGSAIYLSELAALAKQNKNFEIKKIFGLITRDILESYVDNWQEQLFFSSGPAKFTDTVVAMCVALGIPEARIYFEESDMLLYPDHSILASIIDRSLDAIFIADLRGIIKYANNVWQELTGWSAEEVRGEFTPRIVNSGEHSAEFIDIFWSKILSGETFRYDFTNKRKDGTFYNVDEITLAIRNAAGGIIGFVTFQRDIKNRIRVENAAKATVNLLEDFNKEKHDLAEAKAKDEAMLASIGDGIIAVDISRKIIFMNKTAENLLGWNLQEAVGRLYDDIISLEDEKGTYVLPDERPLAKSLSYPGTTSAATTTSAKGLYLLSKNKTKFPVAITVSPIILYGKIIGAIEVFRDITKEKEIDHMRSEFVTIVSHQLRTPLTGIRWTVERLLNKGGMSALAKESLTDIAEEIVRLSDLVGSLLNLSRIESGIISISLEKLDVAALLTEYLNNTKSLFERKALILNFVDNLGKLEIVTDRESLRDIIQSILFNAIEYTPPKGKIDVALEKKAGTFLITIKDSGIGIAEEDRDDIFKRFFRADNAKLFKASCTGIGLFIASEAAKLLGGKIWFESKLNKGTTFYIELPLISKSKNGVKPVPEPSS